MPAARHMPARFKRAVAALSMAAAMMPVAPAAWAQAGDEPAVPMTALNIPQNLTIFGNPNPATRKATAVVNGSIITGTDVEQRVNLILAANQGIKIPAEEMERLRRQMLQNLIDETLEMQEAEANKIEIAQAEIDQSFARVAQNQNMTPEQFTDYLSKAGSSAGSVKHQIHAELAWNRLISRDIRSQTNVSDEEVQTIIDRMEAQKGSDEYRIGEIYLQATPANQEAVAQNAQQILQQIKQGGNFAAYAKQFSQASTAAVGGDLGWVRTAQLPDSMVEAVNSMQVGQIAGPIATPGGMSILYLMDSRKVLTSDPRDALLSLKQLSITFPAGTSREQASGRAGQFAQATQKIKGCGDADAVAKQIGAELVTNDQIRIRDLPAQLQDTLLSLPIGGATPPFGSVEDGVRVLVLCGRDQPDEAEKPSFEQIQSQLEDERVNRRAQIYLRDLRRDAVIDYN